jgi:magnesium transporter
MSRLTKKRSAKAGLPPGSLVHIGEKWAKSGAITVFDYDEKGFALKEAASLDECIPYKDKPTVTWINMDGVSVPEMMEKFGVSYGLHPLVMEDILNTDQRPKFEDYGGYLYIVVRMLYPGKNGEGTGEEVISEQVSIILGPNYVLSFQEQGREGDVFDPVRDRIRNAKGRIRELGADYLAYSLIDSIVDSYFLILEKLGERIEFLEEELVTDPAPATLRVLHRLKSEMIFIRKSVWPLREVISGLERAESPLIREQTKVYLRDIYDHTIQVIDTVETYRDMLSGMMDIYLSSISNRMNEVMKVLTIIATIFIPMTFLAGVYGMNFKYMPELEWRISYPIFWLVIVVTAVVMLVFFKRKKWL